MFTILADKIIKYLDNSPATNIEQIKARPFKIMTNSKCTKYDIINL